MNNKPLNLIAEVISIGDEMTSRQRLDSNSQWLSQQLESLGLRVVYHTTVADSLAANIGVFRQAVQRADIIISTGGLGPTQDDLTRESLAEGFGLSLELRPQALEHIETLFRLRGRPMADRNRVQAMFPAGSTIIPNPHGSAPGIDLEVGPSGNARKSRIFALPGVPAEMVEMWQGTVRSSIEKMLVGGPVVRSAVIKCFGAGESEMEARIPELIARDHDPAVGITVSRATISLRIRAEGSTEFEAENKIDQVRTQIHEQVGQWVFGEGEEFELEHAVGELLAQKSQSLCTLEYGYSALLNYWLSNLERSDLYSGGLAVADRPVSAKLFLESTAADWLLGIDRYPPVQSVLLSGRVQPSRPDREVHTVRLFAVERATMREYEDTVTLAGHPEILHHRIAKSALNWFRKGLLTSWT